MYMRFDSYPNSCTCGGINMRQVRRKQDISFISHIFSNTEKKYDYRIQFENMDKSDLESIVRFVFERDRWMRKKSIGKN